MSKLRRESEIGNMWTSALRLVRKANRLCIMGCSLREEDTLLKLLLTAFIYKNEKSFGDEIDTDKDKKDLKGTKVLKYIKEGERRGYHKRPTCASRRRWYDLGERKPGECLWEMIHFERLKAPLKGIGHCVRKIYKTRIN